MDRILGDFRYPAVMFEGYNPSAVEAKWQKRWDDSRAYAVDLSKAKDPYYLLVMFPYPSGYRLHVGHWFQYSIPDSYARFLRMRGTNVFHPMGFDAFGLPAENHAIKTGTPPAESTAKNVENMTAQFKRMGVTFDWTKSLNTSQPNYYRWTQWLFLQMHEHGLSYKKLGNVNWCQSCQTVLANEQAQDGKCERCGTLVVQKPLEQWFWNITKYAQKLLDNLDDLDWPEKTKLMQQNWIGRSEGAEICFGIMNHASRISVFTTRPDTLFGCTYLVLAPEHPLVDAITTAANKKEVAAYRKEMRGKNDMQRTELAKTKTGVPTGAHAIHPVTGEEIPIWIADYVLMTYGTGAIMAVPGHDERDREFAQKFKLPIKEVVKGAFTEEGIACNSDFLDGLKTPEAKKRMISWLEDHDKGQGKITYRLRDWLISRQRYWGAPIPIVYDPEGKPHSIPEKHLPWLLPTDVEFKPSGESPLKHSKEFKARTEKIFGKGWTPEYDTMDTFVCSSFYYLMFLASPLHDKCTSGKSQFPFDPKIERTWMPVSMYIGGPEHACMHLIYARFVMMALKDFGFVKHEEPFKKLVHQGLITNKGAKMSKSKNNVVDPDPLVERYGSDIFRMYLMFMGPFTDGGDWSDTGIKGIDRFVQRVWRTFGHGTGDKGQGTSELVTALHATIKKVTESLEKMHFNTAISALMEFLNVAEKGKPSREIAQTFAKVIAPLAPHLAEELWEIWNTTNQTFVIDQSWPTYDPKLLVTDTMTIAVQVNGKLRGDIQVPSDAKKEDIIAAAREHENVKKFLTGAIKKEIYVAGKLVSLVV
jgi:leucyl-tRNA synthetase